MTTIVIILAAVMLIFAGLAGLDALSLWRQHDRHNALVTAMLMLLMLAVFVVALSLIRYMPH